MSIVIIVLVNYWLVLPTLFMLFFIVGLQFAYVKASRNLERAESISKLYQFPGSIDYRAIRINFSYRVSSMNTSQGFNRSKMLLPRLSETSFNMSPKYEMVSLDT